MEKKKGESKEKEIEGPKRNKGGRPSLNQKKLTDRIEVWMDEETLKQIKKKSNSYGHKQIPKYIRNLIMVDIERIEKIPNYNLLKLIGEINKIGINLNQIVKFINANNIIETETFLNEINQIKSELIQIKSNL